MITELLDKAVGLAWNYPVMILCLFTGLYFTLIRLPFIQLRGLPHAFALLRGRYDNPDEHGQITHFQALSAALSGTIGLGNIAGVAIAIAMGGPGAVFWMWIVGFLGMATKYIECTLGTYYRDEDEKTGEVRGGPMYYIRKGLGKKWQPVAVFYAICMMFGAFGAGGMFQANQAASAINEFFGIPVIVTGLILAAITGLVIIGGIKRIGSVASKIVPLMCAIYVFGALLICILNIDKYPAVLSIILTDAFSGEAALGGSIGAVIIMGVRRAVFSNEAGLGSASIAHAAVKTDYPVREGIVASMGPLIDTIVVCTATATVIILSGLYGTEQYINTNPQTLSFEQKQLITSPQSKWQVTNQLPGESEAIRQFKDGDFALHYSPSTKIETKKTDLIPVTGSAIRFSCYREHTDGSHIVQVQSKEGKVIKQETLRCKAGHWHSHVIENTSENMPAFVSLVFSDNATKGSWFIDRVQSVKKLSGIELTIAAFDTYIKGFGSIFITIAVFLFAFSSMISWSYYGETASVFAVGKKIIMPFKMVFVIAIFVGSIITLKTILSFSDLMLAFMVIPNTIAIQMAQKEVTHRFDLKDSNTSMTFNEKDSELQIQSKDEYTIRAVGDIFQDKLIKRNISPKAFQFGKIDTALGGTAKQTATIQQGIPQDKAKQITKDIKETKFKVQASIQGDQIRVTGKKRDELQAVMKMVKEKDYGIHIAFGNYR